MRNMGVEFKIIISVTFFTIFIVAMERYQFSKNITEQFIESKKSKNNLLINTITPIIRLNISLGLENANRDYLDQIVSQNSDLEFIQLMDTHKKVTYSYIKETKNTSVKNELALNYYSEDILDSISREKLGHMNVRFSNDDYELLLCELPLRERRELPRNSELMFRY